MIYNVNSASSIINGMEFAQLAVLTQLPNDPDRKKLRQKKK